MEAASPEEDFGRPPTQSRATRAGGRTRVVVAINRIPAIRSLFFARNSIPQSHRAANSLREDGAWEVAADWTETQNSGAKSHAVPLGSTALSSAEPQKYHDGTRSGWAGRVDTHE